MGRTSSYPIKDPKQLLLEKGRIYAYKKHYLQLYVFSSWVSEMRTLQHAYGGNVYPHGSGYKWMLSKRRLLTDLVKELNDDLPSTHKWEDPIKKYYIEEIK